MFQRVFALEQLGGPLEMMENTTRPLEQAVPRKP
jgi:hypothetical protein